MGLALEQLFDKWEDFCYSVKSYEIDYSPTEVDGVMDRMEMSCLFDATMDAFQEKMGYSSRTIARIHTGPCYFDSMDIWFKEFWRGEGYVLKEEED